MAEEQKIISFEYDTHWLEKSSAAFFLDPDLQLYRGRQYVPLDKNLFGIFSDSCPDFNLALDTAQYYGIRHEDAEAAVFEIKQIVGNHWRKIAGQYGLSRSAVDYMEPAFHMQYK